MHVTRFLDPRTEVRQYVRLYVQTEARLSRATLVHPVLARTAPMLEFVFGDLPIVRRSGSSTVDRSPATVVAGLPTHRRLELLVRGTVEEFVIFFQPAALHRLFSVPMGELTDRDFEARAVFGPWIDQLRQRLGERRSFAERARIADEFFLRRGQSGAQIDVISMGANEIVRSGGRGGISWLARRAGLSVRQFERRFLDQVGIPPKVYARIARFEAALDSKAKSLAKSWTDVAHEFGYHDQMHMIHDFAQLSGATPTALLAEVNAFHYVALRPMQSAPDPARAGSPRLIL